MYFVKVYTTAVDAPTDWVTLWQELLLIKKNDRILMFHVNYFLLPGLFLYSVKIKIQTLYQRFQNKLPMCDML